MMVLSNCLIQRQPKTLFLLHIPQGQSSRPKRECYLLVLNSVTSTQQWMRHQSRAICIMFVRLCVLVCKCVNLCYKVPGPFIPRTALPMPFLAFRRSHFA